MWKIKDLVLKDKINQLVVSDDRIATCCREQMKDPTDYISLESEVFKLSMRVDKDYFEEFPEYNPDGWNPFPEVNPPECGEYLVTFKDEDADYVQQNYFDMLGRWGTAHSDVIAFRALPAPYQPETNK